MTSHRQKRFFDPDRDVASVRHRLLPWRHLAWLVATVHPQAADALRMIAHTVKGLYLIG
jgi:hypothetical protein